MNFDAQARRRAQALLEALTNHIVDATKTEHSALVAAVDARMAALQEALAHPDQAQLLERLVQDLSSAAQEQAEAVAIRVRFDAEHVAEAEVAAARAEAQEQLAAAQAEAQAQLAAAQAQLAAAQVEAQAQLAAAQAANAGLLEAVEEARQQVRVVQDAAQTEIERTRLELEARLERVQAAHAELTSALADARRDAVAARSDAEAQTASLKLEQGRAEALEQERAQILLARDEAGKHLEAETRRAGELAEALEAARQEASLANVEVAGRQRELEVAAERIRTLNEIRMKLEADAQERAGIEEKRRDPDVMLLDRLGTALRSLNGATNASEILETVIEQLGQHFARAAVFLVGASSFRGWRGRGLGPNTDISNVAIPRTIDSLLTRTLADRKPVSVAWDDGDTPIGLSGSPVACAVAFPILASGRVMAVAYAEDADQSAAISSGVGRKIAEILIEHANRRLAARPRSSPSSAAPADPAYSPARQARRVKVQDGIEVTLDGASGFLVDLSTIGAQVLSPLAMRPNRLVTMTTAGERALGCKGRVVWALFEQPRGAEAAQYRVGVKFTESESQAVEAFLLRYGIESPERAPEAAKLEDTA